MLAWGSIGFKKTAKIDKPSNQISENAESFTRPRVPDKKSLPAAASIFLSSICRFAAEAKVMVTRTPITLKKFDPTKSLRKILLSSKYTG
jgi:hypothetical protein